MLNPVIPDTAEDHTVDSAPAYIAPVEAANTTYVTSSDLKETKLASVEIPSRLFVRYHAKCDWIDEDGGCDGSAFGCPSSGVADMVAFHDPCPPQQKVAGWSEARWEEHRKHHPEWEEWQAEYQESYCPRHLPRVQERTRLAGSSISTEKVRANCGFTSGARGSNTCQRQVMTGPTPPGKSGVVRTVDGTAVCSRKHALLLDRRMEQRQQHQARNLERLFGTSSIAQLDLGDGFMLRCNMFDAVGDTEGGETQSQATRYELACGRLSLFRWSTDEPRDPASEFKEIRRRFDNGEILDKLSVRMTGRLNKAFESSDDMIASSSGWTHTTEL